ncbi:LAFE_0A00804g1_1 [Lachancea fermentati]|uniref:Vacuolar membrane-associated protein IML1 n=1 Tax=Lachancea fermentati TaxID=4955 RepID=A0A1G4M686_LACFM|nr:LAFE_0A00804g1_1 [Lachancea fermentati]
MSSDGPKFKGLRSGNRLLNDSSNNLRAKNSTGSVSLTLSSTNTSGDANDNMKIENNTLIIGGPNNFRRLRKPQLGALNNKSHLRGQSTQPKSSDGYSTKDDHGDGNGKEAFMGNYDTQTNGQKSKLKRRSYKLELGFHEARFSEELVMLDTSQVPGSQEGDLVELKTYRGAPGNKGKKIYFIVKPFDRDFKSRYKNAQVSILSGQLQQLLDLPTRSKVWIKIKSKKQYEADLIELNVKDCLVNRGDMWVFSSQLVNTCVFSDQKIVFLETVRATVKGIYRDGKKLLSGYIGENTRIIFRSESARLIFLIQITDEMWHFEENGEIMFHKVVNSLFPKIFKKWKAIGTHHVITIVFSTSIDLSDVPFRDIADGERLSNTKDYYRIVVDQVNIVHWSEIMKTLRREFMNIAKDLKNVKTEDGNSIIRGRFCPVIKSNVLESVCFAATLITNPFRQPDLRRTTTHVILISPGSGLYDVQYDLLKETSRKLLSIEMTIDIICLTRAPLHIVPLLRYRDYDNRLRYCAPTWLSISFWNDSSKAQHEWHPRCKMHDLQMMGLTETEMKGEIAIDHMTVPSDVKSITEFMSKYDHCTFTDQRILRNRDDRSSISSDFIKSKERTAKDSREKGKKKNSLSWKTPKSASPMVQTSDISQVFGDLSNQGTVATVFHQTTQKRHRGKLSSEGSKSLAVDTLRSVTKGRSVSNFTQRIVSKIIPDIDLKTKRSVDSLPTSVSKEHEMTQNINDSYPNSIVASKSIPVLKQNLSSFGGPKLPFEMSRSQPSSVYGSPRLSLSMEKKPILPDLSERSARMRSDHTFHHSWIEINNPSTPVSAEKAGLLIPARWKDVFPKFVMKKYSKWRSLTMPADLPVTFSTFPTKHDFDSNFSFTNHSVVLNLDQELNNQTTFDLLRDMIYVRLLAGFQICLGENVNRIEASKTKEKGNLNIAKYLSKDNFMSAKIYLMIDNEIHRLGCSYDGTIEVQRHIRKAEGNISDSIASYNPQIKTRYETEYRETMMDPLRRNRESCNWNQLDQVLAGYGDSIIEQNKKQFRSKFVILPAQVPPNTFSSTINGRKETLSAEEIRLEGLRRVISSIFRARIMTDREKSDRKSSKDEIFPEVLFYTGSLFDFIDEQMEILKTSGTTTKDSIFIDEGDRLNKDSDLSKLAYEMQCSKAPLKLVNRKWHWKRHENCFIGLEMVNWIIEHYSDIDTREEAVLYGQNLMNKGLFVHVENRHGFLDGHYFYQISPTYVYESKSQEKSKVDSKSFTENKSSKRGRSASNRSDSASSALHSSVSKQNSAAASKRDDREEVSKTTVLLSNVLTINVDPTGKSYKSETCRVHYDRVHNPDHCFHIRLEWLTATPKLIDDLINNWARLCERYGLKLVEVPWDELCTIPLTNPFHSFVDITLAINPWDDLEFENSQIMLQNKYYYHRYLLEKSGFLVDNRASKFLRSDTEYEIMYSWGRPKFKFIQYVHCTGAYIAEIRENGNLFLAPNNNHLSRVNIGNITGKRHNSPKFFLDSQKVMLDFRETCLNYDKLRIIFLEAKERWLEHNTDDDFTGLRPLHSKT